MTLRSTDTTLSPAEQLGLFDPRPRHNGTTTSREAAESVRELTGAMRKRVLNAISASLLGMTCDEVEQHLGMSHQTASARVNELARGGYIEDDGTRPTRSGRNAKVWRAR